MRWFFLVALVVEAFLTGEMTYRNAQVDDAHGISQVFMECYNISSLQEGIDVFHEETKKGYNYIVAVEGDEVVGISSWIRQGLFKHRLCELSRIAVKSAYRTNGIAQQLFIALERSARDEYARYGFPLRKMYILTHANNLRAHSFYKKMGCVHEATLKNHYYADMDEWVFTKFYDNG